MRERLTVLAMINDTVVEHVHVAERVTCQIYVDGRLQLQLWNDGSITEHVGYRRAEHFRREVIA